MGRGQGKGGKSGGGPEDDPLWADYTSDITPIDKKPAKTIITPSEKAVVKRVKASAPPLPAPVSKPQQQPPQLDGRLEQRLKRGQVAIDGTLDLHGMTQEQAHTKLNGYITTAQARGKRCLLIITGKGRVSEAGVLKQKFPQWCAMAPLKDIILKILPAVQKDGGSGAWYVYLKRQRDY